MRKLYTLCNLFKNLFRNLRAPKMPIFHPTRPRRLFLFQFLSILAQFYYILVNFAFRLVNWPKSSKSVGWTSDERDNKLLRISAKRAAEQIRRKQITSTQLVAACIARAQGVQPLVNAIVAENFDAAMAEAEAVDDYLGQLDEQSDEFKKLPFTKPLLGVPFTLKNNLDASGFVTVAGCRKFLINRPAKPDSIIVKRGAILLALTNLPKLAMGADANNDVYGRTRNPYDLRRIPGGSSGGEGAIIASGASIFGIGNDLGGSVRVPAAMCGVFGLKPTKDAVPLDGFVPPITSEIARAQWSIGPLCRYAEDLPLIFSTISGKPLSDMAISYDFTEVRILYMEDLHIWFVERLHASVREVVRKTARYFETTFKIAPQKVDFPLAHHLYEIWGALGFGEPAKSPSWLATEFVKLFLGRSDMTATAWSLSVLHTCVETRNAEERNFMLNKLEKLRGQMADALEPRGILLLPVWPSPTPFHQQNMCTPFNLAYCQLANVIGFPSLVCPMGMDPSGLGIPLSVQLVGVPNSEPLLMAAARKLECAFGGWTEPGGV